MGAKPRTAPLRRHIDIAPGLAMRTLELTDAKPLFALVDANRYYLRQWMPWLDFTTCVEEIIPFLQSCIDGYATGTCMRWTLLIDGELSGMLSLEEISELHRGAKIGYWQSNEYQGRGYMTRAVQALIRYGFAERALHLIEIRAAVENRKSRAVAERVGMSFEGIQREREWLYDHFVDHAVYTLLETEWAEGLAM